jgi:cytochrome c
MNPRPAIMVPGWAVLLVAGNVLAAAPRAPAPDEATLRRGEQVYARCIACHAIEANRTGPQHCGLFGRRAGTAPGFTGYSKALQASKIVWNAQTLDRFLQDPMKAVPGTTMGYAGVKDPKERADLIAWLGVATRPGQGCTPER